MSVSGFVDRVWAEGVSGWSPAPRVLVSVNGAAVGSVACTNPRPDVQAAGLSADGRVGFRAPLALAWGDVVRVTTPQGQRNWSSRRARGWRVSAWPRATPISFSTFMTGCWAPRVSPARRCASGSRWTGARR